MTQILLWWRCLSRDSLLKLSSACANIAATSFIGLVEFYYSPDVRLLQSSPIYPESLKWFARTLLVLASILSVVIAVRGAIDDIRNEKLTQGSLKVHALASKEPVGEGEDDGVVDQDLRATDDAGSGPSLDKEKGTF